MDPRSCTTSFSTNSALKNATYADVDAVVLSHFPSSVLLLGVNNVTWTAMDTMLQATNCTQKVTVVGMYQGVSLESHNANDPPSCIVLFFDSAVRTCLISLKGQFHSATLSAL